MFEAGGSSSGQKSPTSIFEKLDKQQSASQIIAQQMEAAGV